MNPLFRITGFLIVATVLDLVCGAIGFGIAGDLGWRIGYHTTEGICFFVVGMAFGRGRSIRSIFDEASGGELRSRPSRISPPTV